MGIFNFEFFVWTLPHPFCVANRNSVEVMCLSYFIAASPLVMIFIH